MKLTERQIQQLYIFTRQHFVEHYDVQTELVDHLANDIEKIWQEKPSLTYEEARTVSFKKFGVFGFMNVVESQTKALDKKYWKIIFRFVKGWFKVPKIMLTLAVFLSIFSISRLYYGNYFLFAVLILFTLFAFYKTIRLQKIFKNNFKKNGKKWMLEELIFKTGAGAFFAFPINIFNIMHMTTLANETSNSNWQVFLIAAIFTALLILFYIIVEVLPKKAEDLLAETYPEYKFV